MQRMRPSVKPKLEILSGPFSVWIQEGYSTEMALVCDDLPTDDII